MHWNVPFKLDNTSSNPYFLRYSWWNEMGFGYKGPESLPSRLYLYLLELMPALPTENSRGIRSSIRFFDLPGLINQAKYLLSTTFHPLSIYPHIPKNTLQYRRQYTSPD